MRNAFFRALQDLAAADRRITLVVGDLGFGVAEPFARQFPSQFVNAGVAEQNMTGVAAGMALMGRIVFTYSIANFSTLRCLEQIRSDVCYHHADVKVVALGGGFAYGALGVTHHATEDLAVLRSLPGRTVVAPGDRAETELATRAIAARPGPCYLRLGRSGETLVHRAEIPFEIGKALCVRDGQDLTIISTGGMLATAVEATELLALRDISARLLSMHTLKPLDSDAILSAARETRAVVTLEEHSAIGGLGSAVAEVLAGIDAPRAPLQRFCLPSQFAAVAGSQEFLRNAHGLNAETVAQSAMSLLETVRF